MTADNLIQKLWMILVVSGLVCVPLHSRVFAQISEAQVQRLNSFREAEMKHGAARQARWAAARLLPGQEVYDANFYQIDIEVFPESRTIQAAVKAVGTSLVAGLSEVMLDFSDRLTIDSVRVEGQAMQYHRQGQVLTVPLGASLSRGDQFSVTVVYHGYPYVPPEYLDGFFFETHGDQPVIATSCEIAGAHWWWPCKDHPSDKPDSVAINVTVPLPLVVASNGLLRDVIDHGDTRTYKWFEHYPIQTYNVALNISNYTAFYDQYKTLAGDSMRIEYYVYPEHYLQAVRSFAVTPEVLGVFARAFGEYPFVDEKYGMAEVPFFGMEHQTIIAYGNTFPTVGLFDYIIVHEMAHEWWGNAVSLENWGHFWLNEGFATYSEAVYVEEKYGHQMYLQYMGLLGNSIGQSGTVFAYDSTTAAGAYFGGSPIYTKGAWVLHMLRKVVGDSAFWETLRTYQSHPDFRYKNAATWDFAAVAEDVSGRELDWFFDQWVYQPGYPVFEYGWSNATPDADSSHLNVFINQTRPAGTLFTMPVELGLVMAGGDTLRQSVWVDAWEAEFEIQVPGEVRDVLLDPDGWILKDVRKVDEPRLAFNSYAVLDSAGNGRADPGEQVGLVVRVRNSGAGAWGLVGTLATDASDVTVLVDQATFGDAPHGGIVDNPGQPFEIEIASGAAGGYRAFHLTLRTGDGKESQVTFLLAVGQAPLLLVDDDAGAGYEHYFNEMMVSTGLFANRWDVEAAPPPADTLSKFGAAIWFTGDDSTSALTADEQGAIRGYLALGGRLLLTGQNIGFDLALDGSSADSLFYADVLHARLIDHRIGDDMTVGVPGDPVAGGLFAYFVGDWGGAGNQSSPSAIEPLGPAEAIMRYAPSGLYAGLRWQDTVTDARLIYLPFGLEGVAGPYEDSARRLLASCVLWLSGSDETAVEKGEADIPLRFELSANYPNPLIEGTRWQISLPTDAMVGFQVFDVLGRKVTAHQPRHLRPGRHTIRWDGRDSDGRAVAAGVYLVLVEARGERWWRKVVVVK